MLQEQSFDTTTLKLRINRLYEEVTAAYELVQSDIATNARIARNQTEYRKSHDELVNKYEEICGRYKKSIFILHGGVIFFAGIRLCM